MTDKESCLKMLWNCSIKLSIKQKEKNVVIDPLEMYFATFQNIAATLLITDLENGYGILWNKKHGPPKLT